MPETKRRIHHLAKELGVKSQSIIEKCAAEGIEIKNHMHVVSAGLEATIHEWFTEGAHTTTFEESRRVDLEKVRVKRKRAPSKQVQPPAEKAPEETLGEAAASAAGVEPALQVVEDLPPAEHLPAVAAASAFEPAPLSAASDDEPPEQDRPARAAAEASPVEEKPAPSEPKPVGPQNIPKPAKLTGPRVIRIERPDYVEPPRPAVRPTYRPVSRDPVAARVGDAAEVRHPVKRDQAAPAVRDDDAETVSRRAHPRRGARDDRDVASEQLREWRERDVLEMRERLAQASGRGIGAHRAVEKSPGGRFHKPIKLKKDKIELTEPIYVRDFSRETGLPVLDIVNQLRTDHGVMAGINSVIEPEHAHLIAGTRGIELTIQKAKTGLDVLAEEFSQLKRKRLVQRPPVVTVLGHVDHGKTSLLDRIRQTSVTKGEAGGITQHIGASRVQVGDTWVTFLDTPGHAAFTAMRARGANLTDVVVLVVAADDGVMPTTLEAINHARAANSHIVVALNKIDLPHDINQLFGQLSEHGLTPSGDWGGETDVIKTSAATGQGVDELLNHLATLSEVMELKADPTIPATGTVIEAERSDRIGNVVRLLVQDGTLRTGQVMVCGCAHGRVRSMKDDQGRAVQTAGPSTPVEVTGLSDVPEAGDKFYVLKIAQRAKEIAEEVAALRRVHELARVGAPTSLESVIASAEEGATPELNVIIRADVAGSIDALKQELSGLASDEVRLTILHAGVGTVTESDLMLAKASSAIVIAFHVVPDPSVQRKADGLGVEIRTYLVIYEVLDDIKKALEGLLEPEEKLESRGRAEVREIFSISKVGKIAGCLVRDGLLNRNCQVRVIRDGVVVKDRAGLESLRRFKDDVKEVRSGLECGVRITNFDDVKPGDVIEAFEVLKVARTLQLSA